MRALFSFPPLNQRQFSPLLSLSCGVIDDGMDLGTQERSACFILRFDYAFVLDNGIFD